mmetsp:Transcript_17234/g.40144  ORF Transcript_17234/g.40144 Transcript_17234/m.40144 type:complete len:88 (-) Transcript_17234:1408-1671(-)
MEPSTMEEATEDAPSSWEATSSDTSEAVLDVTLPMSLEYVDVLAIEGEASKFSKSTVFRRASKRERENIRRFLSLSRNFPECFSSSM